MIIQYNLNPEIKDFIRMSNSDPKCTQEEKASTENIESKLQTESVEEKLQLESVKEKLQTESVKEKLQSQSVEEKIQTESVKETIYVDDDKTLIASALERKCTVSLIKLSEDEIGKYMQKSFSQNLYERPYRKEKSIANYNLKVRQRYDFTRFDDFKKSRQDFLKRKKGCKGDRKKTKFSTPTKKCKFQIHESHLLSSKKETEEKDGPSFLGMPLEQSPNTSPCHSIEELSPHKVFPRSKISDKYKTKFRLKKAKKRKTPILDSDSDFDDSFNSSSSKKNYQGSTRNFGFDANASNKITLSGSNSATSKENQEFYNKFKHHYPHLDASFSKLDDSDLSIISNGVSPNVAKPKLSKNVERPVENKYDVVSQIMNQMDSSNMPKKGNISISKSAADKSKLYQQPWKGNIKKKASHLVLNQKFVRSSDGGNSKNAVLQTVNNLVNIVCQDEPEPNTSTISGLLNNSVSARRCTFCFSLFPVKNPDDTMCVICNDKKGKLYSKNYKKKFKKEKKKKEKYQNAKKYPKINMRGQVLKKLPESEKNRLLYKGNNDFKQESDKKMQSTSDKKQEVGTSPDKLDNTKIKLIINKVRGKLGKGEGKIFEINKVKKSIKQTVKSLSESNVQKSTESNYDSNDNSKDKREMNIEESPVNKFALKKTTNGLFLLTVTKSDEELDFDTVSPTKSIKEYTNQNLSTANPSINISSLPVENGNFSANVQNKVDSSDQQNLTSSVLLIPKNPNINVNAVIFTQNSNVPTYPTGTFNFNSNTLQAVNNSNTSFIQRTPLLQQSLSVVQQNSPLLLQNQVIVQQNSAIQPNQTLIQQSQPNVFQNQTAFVQYQPQFIQNQQQFLKYQHQSLQKQQFVQNQNPMLSSMLQYQQSNQSVSLHQRQLPIQQSHQSVSLHQSHQPPIQQSHQPVLIQQNQLRVQENQIPVEQNASPMQPNLLPASQFQTEKFEVDVASVAHKIKQEMFTEHEQQQKNLNQSHDSPNVSQEGTTNESAIDEASKSDSTNNNVQVPIEISEIVKTAMLEIEAISVIAVLDLDDNVVQNFANIYDKEMTEYNKLKNTDDLPEDMKNSETLHMKIRSHMSKIQLFTVVQKFIQQYGSFTKLAESILGISADNVEAPQTKTSVIIAPPSSNPKLEQRRQSCQFAEPVESEQQLPSPMSDVPLSPIVNVKLEKMSSGTNSCFSNGLSTGTNSSHIERLESQISSMSAPLYPSLAETHSSSSAPSFPAPIPAFEPFPNQVSSAVAPRNELINEARQTPSTGSGSRTPSRPESARSHVDEHTMSAAEIKKEKIESAIAINNCKQEKAAESRSACSYFQAPETTQERSITDNILQEATSIQHLLDSSKQVPGITEKQNMQNILEPTNQIQPNAESTNFQVYHQSIQGYGVQSPQQMQGAPMMHNMQNNQTFHQSSTQQTQNPNLQHLQALLTSSNFQRQPVVQRQNNAYSNACFPSTRQPYLMTKEGPPPNRTVAYNGRLFNANQRFQQPANPNNAPNRFIIRNSQGQQINVQQVVIPNHTSGTVMQQNPVIFSQNAYTSSNNYVLQQPPSSSIYTSEMNTQNNSAQNSYTAPSSGSQVNQQLNSVTSPAPPPYVLQNQPHPIQNDNPTDIMYCAECMKLATLRCKQCAKVAYCNTNCAKIYWHRRHKVECKIMAAGTM